LAWSGISDPSGLLKLSTATTALTSIVSMTDWSEPRHSPVRGSLSKSVAPGYRIGWVIANRYRDDLIEWKQATSSAMCSLPQMAMADYLRSGAHDRHLERLRRAYRLQVEKMRFTLARHLPDGVRISEPQGGFVLWVELPRGIDSLELLQAALAEGISLTPGLLFSATRRYRNYIRVNCGHPWDQRIEDGVVRLGALVRERTLRQ
jgi:DNA-binding transcriptional MocR family regulator